MEKLRGFFSAFFQLETILWGGFLAGWPGLPGNEFHDAWNKRLGFALKLFAFMPNPVRAAMMCVGGGGRRTLLLLLLLVWFGAAGTGVAVPASGRIATCSPYATWTCWPRAKRGLPRLTPLNDNLTFPATPNNPTGTTRSRTASRWGPASFGAS